jgi:CheY-like chemotaxis protein
MLFSRSHQEFTRASTARDVPVANETPILIVDDDRGSAKALGALLATRGYDELRWVRSEARAISIAETFRPAIIFLDIDPPGPERLQLAARLRQAAGRPTVRLIALTSMVEHTLREEARAAGFERYLVKPLAQAELDKVMRLPPT